MSRITSGSIRVLSSSPLSSLQQIPSWRPSLSHFSLSVGLKVLLDSSDHTGGDLLVELPGRASLSGSGTAVLVDTWLVEVMAG
jgi:hypothetical protein